MRRPGPSGRSDDLQTAKFSQPKHLSYSQLTYPTRQSYSPSTAVQHRASSTPDE